VARLLRRQAGPGHVGGPRAGATPQALLARQHNGLTLPLPFSPERSDAENKGVAPGMGRKLKVKVLLETRQTESNTEDKGGPVRGRLVEVVGAARNRAKAKHRKARVSWVSQPPVAKPVVCQTASCIGDGVRVKLSVLTRGDLPASVGNHGSR
jgi:hypothetical protein